MRGRSSRFDWPGPVRRTLLAALATLPLHRFARAQVEEGINPPFITTPHNIVERMLTMAGTNASDTVVDLGSGDGRIVMAAVRDFGARALGLELDPKLVAVSREAARDAGLSARAEFRVADVLREDFSHASVVTAYLLPWLLTRLEHKLLYDLKPGTRIVTHAFKITGWTPDRSESLLVAPPDPKAGAETTIHLWIVPAQARGTWQAAPNSARRDNWRLQIQQNFQEVDVSGTVLGEKFIAPTTRLSGRRITFDAPLGREGSRLSFDGEIDGELMRGQVVVTNPTGKNNLAVEWVKQS